jgi:hypothetical protein
MAAKLIRDIKVDYIYWARMPFWKIDEAVALYLGITPEIVSHHNVLDFEDGHHCLTLISNFGKLVRRTIEAGQLVDPIQPNKFVAWLPILSVISFLPTFIGSIRVKKLRRRSMMTT